MSFKQQYFSSTLIARNAKFSYADVAFDTANEQSGFIKEFSLKSAVEYTPQSEAYKFSFYLGPNKYSVLRKVVDERGESLSLERAIPLGWILSSWISRWVVIPVFDFLQQYIASFGLIILILTLLVKIVIFPLTYKSYLSTAKMRVLKPEIEAINAKYPKQEDAMKKQQATMELYKKAADMAVELNSRGIVVIVGKRHVLLPPPIDYILSLSRESVMRILDYTQYTDLCLNIETLSANLIDTVKETATFVDSIGSDRVKICFDVANVYTQEDVTEAARIAGNRINLVHISDSYKDHTAHDVIGTGEIDFAKVREALEMVNYNGSVVIEITDKGGIESINRSRDHLLKEGWVF